MDYKTAKEIADLRCDSDSLGTPNVISAIKILRGESNMGLLEAKTYLEQHSRLGADKTRLLQQLCSDFVKSTVDLLREAEVELRRQEMYVRELRQTVATEEREAQLARMNELKAEGKTEAEIAHILGIPESSVRMIRVTQHGSGATALVSEDELRKNPHWVERLDGPTLPPIILEKREDAERVIGAMNDIIARFNHIAISDLYDLVGLPTRYVHTRWGWTEPFTGEVIRQIRAGYTFELPEVTQLPPR